MDGVYDISETIRDHSICVERQNRMRLIPRISFCEEIRENLITDAKFSCDLKED